MAQAVRRSACDMGIAGSDEARAAPSSPGVDRPWKLNECQPIDA